MEVHPPDHALHSWRDFFIHIATIVVGLLIAIGLEQTVEWIHRLHEVRVTRRELREEQAENLKLFHRNVSLQRASTADLLNDLKVLQYLKQHPGTPDDALPGLLRAYNPVEPFKQNAWNAALQTNTALRLSPEEIESERLFAEEVKEFTEAELSLYNALFALSDYSLEGKTLSQLTPAEIDKEFDTLIQCLRLQRRTTAALMYIASDHPAFAPGPTEEEIQALIHRSSSADIKLRYPHAFEQWQRAEDEEAAYDRAHGGQPQP